jgi:predicted Zn-dependent protease
LTDDDSITLELISLSALLASDPAKVRERALALSAAAPESRALALLAASAALKLGDAACAIATLEPWVVREPRTAVLRLLLGRAYGAAGRTVEAVDSLREALALEADLADGWRELARQLFLLGDEAGGDTAYLHYSRLLKSPAELSGATAALLEGRLDAAAQMLTRHLASSPDDALAWRLRGEVDWRRQRPADAEPHLLRCLALTPGDAAARYALAACLHELNRSEEALPLLDRLLKIEPDETLYLGLKAKALRQITHDDEALALLEQATARHPDSASLLLLYGHILQEVGRVEESIGLYRRATALSPGAGWWSLANTKTYRFTEAELASMRDLLKAGRAQLTDRTHLEFALGKALENAGEYEESFQHYSTGNGLHRGTFTYRPLAVENTTKRMCEIFTTEFFELRQGWGSDRTDPIFIVGLPRSGSTLLEQMLASHSQIEGTHELPELPAMAASLAFQPGGDGSAARRLPTSLTAADVEAFADDYLKRTRRYRKLETPRFTDKQLGNFRNVALIHLMFPRASIIDIRRHPMACGFACYRQHFTRELPFCYDLVEFGRYYRDYVRWMAHVDAVLPGRVHRVHYERLVSDPEGEVRKIVDYCGLPFEPDCLRFHLNRRVVRTISSEQVRRPIYTDSLEHWRHYEPWLAPLREALGELVDTYPGAAR